MGSVMRIDLNCLLLSTSWSSCSLRPGVSPAKKQAPLRRRQGGRRSSADGASQGCTTDVRPWICPAFKKCEKHHLCLNGTVTHKTIVGGAEWGQGNSFHRLVSQEGSARQRRAWSGVPLVEQGLGDIEEIAHVLIVRLLTDWVPKIQA